MSKRSIYEKPKGDQDHGKHLWTDRNGDNWICVPPPECEKS